MKPIQILYSALYVFFILASCTKESKEIQEDPEENNTINTGVISIEGVDGFDFTDLTVLSFEDSSQVGAEGRFEIKNETSDGEQLPVLFLKDNEIIFGYYQNEDTDEAVSLDDMLLFYFSLHPEVILQGISKTALLEKIKTNPNYETLKGLIVSSLDSDASPFKNESFVNLLNTTGYSLNYQINNYQKAKQSDVYRFTYSRDGTVSWPKQFPVYCTVGMEVVNASNGTSLTGPQILDKSGLVLSAGSAIEWLHDYFANDESNNYGTFKFPSEGQYEIRFTNGVDKFGTPGLESKVDGINRFNLGVDLISFMIPIGIKEILGEADCRDALIAFFKNVPLTGIKTALYLNGNLNKSALENELFNMSNDIYDVIVKCALDGSGIGFIDKVKDISGKYFDKVQDGASLVLFLRDYLASDLQGNEIRYYYDGVSFGSLEFTNLSGVEYINAFGNTTFLGEKDSEHTFKARVEEEIFTYEIERGIFSSKVTPKKGKESALGIPFSLVPGNEGDATVNNVSKLVETRIDKTLIAETIIDGTLKATFKMGEKDTEFELRPNFRNANLSSEKILCKINDGLKIGDFYEGGIVFYVDGTGEHGLVCALNDQAKEVKWGCDKFDIPGADGSAIGTGEQNTTDILASNCDDETAAKYADGGGWFLPSINELKEMGKHQLDIEKTALENGGSEFDATFYYSSTETSSTSVGLLHFHYMYGPKTPEYPYGTIHGTRYESGPKWREVYNVRAVKAF